MNISTISDSEGLMTLLYGGGGGLHNIHDVSMNAIGCGF